MNYKPETFPQPGGPQRMREGISCDCSRDLSRVCSPSSLFWPKYSSRVLGLKTSAKGLSLLSFNALGEDAPGPSGVSITLRPGPGVSAGSLTPGSLALGLVWNRENTAAAGWVSGVLVRAFLDGGPDGSCWAVSVWCWWTPPLCKHSSKCALILSGPKSPAHTGHFTVTLSDTFSAIVALGPRVYSRSSYPHVVKECSSESVWRGRIVISRYSSFTDSKVVNFEPQPQLSESIRPSVKLLKYPDSVCSLHRETESTAFDSTEDYIDSTEWFLWTDSF